jgi:hypothetical protein
MRVVNARSRGLAIGLVCLAVILQSGCNDSRYMAGIDGSGSPVYAQGPIEGFGSIVVNGQHYEVSAASIRVNGEVATEDDLELGQIVAVQARIDPNGARVADTVDFEANIRGPVQSVDAASGTMQALEQQISIGAETTIVTDSGGGIDTLTIGDYVEVSGLLNAVGDLAATRVVQVSRSSELRIIGTVEQLNLGSFTFAIGNLVVDYSGAALIEGFPAGMPANGDLVLAIGASRDAFGALTANRLSLIQSDDLELEGQEAEVEGLITRFTSPTDFDVAGRRSTTTASTSYEGGTVADLQLNVKIQIEGRFDAAGTIVADQIEVKDGGAVY